MQLRATPAPLNNWAICWSRWSLWSPVTNLNARWLQGVHTKYNLYSVLGIEDKKEKLMGGSLKKMHIVPKETKWTHWIFMNSQVSGMLQEHILIERESAMMHDKNYHLKVTVSQQCGEHLREMLNTSCDTSKTPSWMFWRIVEAVFMKACSTLPKNQNYILGTQLKEIQL